MTAGAVIKGLNVSGSITVRANNVTIQNTKITASGTGGAAVSAGRVSGLTIKNSEISGGNVFDGRATLSGVYMHNCDECAQYATSIKDSYLIANQSNAGSHYEPVYGDTDTLDVEHSVLLNPHSQTAAVFMDTTGGGACSNHLTINDSLLAGGGYTLYPCGNASSAGSSVITITNNRFARCTTSPVVHNNAGGGNFCSGVGSPNGDVVTKPDSTGYFPNGGGYGLDASVFCGQTTWSNNVWDDDGRSVAC